MIFFLRMTYVLRSSYMHEVHNTYGLTRDRQSKDDYTVQVYRRDIVQTIESRYQNIISRYLHARSARHALHHYRKSMH